MADRVVNTVLQQVVGDGTGKLIETPFVGLADKFGNPIDLDDTLKQIVDINRRQLAVLRALLAHFNGPDGVSALEEDYLNLD